MISRPIRSLIVALAASLCAISPSHADLTTAQQNKIKSLTKQLKKLPNQGAFTFKIKSLVKKLVKLRPEKTSQYYAIGLRKSNAPGLSGNSFAESLNRDIQKLLKKSDLPKSARESAVRRLNKVERLYVPPATPPPPPPYQASVGTLQDLT